MIFVILSFEATTKKTQSSTPLTLIGGGTLLVDSTKLLIIR